MNKIRIGLLAIVFLIFIMCIVYKVEAVDNDLPLLGRVIFVDPGHPSLDKPNVIVMSCSK